MARKLLTIIPFSRICFSLNIYVLWRYSLNLSIQFLNSLLIMKHHLCTTVLKYIIPGLIFLGCSTFVTLRGYKCFMKYLDAPQSNSISYKFNSRVAFPSISFCQSEWIKNEGLQKCHLSKDEYIKGKNDSNMK